MPVKSDKPRLYVKPRKCFHGLNWCSGNNNVYTGYPHEKCQACKWYDSDANRRERDAVVDLDDYDAAVEKFWAQKVAENSGPVTTGTMTAEDIRRYGPPRGRA